jgi:hypothetical protein
MHVLYILFGSLGDVNVQCLIDFCNGYDDASCSK